MAYGDFKDLTRKTASDKSFKISKTPKIDGYERRLSLMIYKFFDKKHSGVAIKNEKMSNKELAEEFEKRKVNSPFMDNIWGTDFSNIQLISKFNKGICFSSCVIDIFSKYAWVIPLKDKKRYYNY